MSQGKPCLVGALGLLEHEVRLVKSILRHANERNPSRYEWADDLHGAHVAIVNADNQAALGAWQELAGISEAPVLLLITSGVGQSGSCEYAFARPFSPLKLAALLDKIVHEKLAKILEGKIFEGELKAAPSVKSFVKGNGSAINRALVVDDSPTVRKQLGLELAFFNINVDAVESGEQCLDMLEKSSYNIIFLDVVLPGSDGYEVCKKIKKNERTKHTPVIMLTSKSSSLDRVRGAMAGCNSYLTKPVDYERFHKILEQYLTEA